MPYMVDPKEQFMRAMTMDQYSPWTQMMLQQEIAGPGNPPPFVPVPVPVPVPSPDASSTTVDPERRPPPSSTTVDPLPSSDSELLRQLMRPYNKGWRKGVK